MLHALYICIVAPIAVGLALAALVVVPTLTAHFYPGQLGPQLLGMVASIAWFITTIIGVQGIARCWRKSA